MHVQPTFVFFIFDSYLKRRLEVETLHHLMSTNDFPSDKNYQWSIYLERYVYDSLLGISIPHTHLLFR